MLNLESVARPWSEAMKPNSCLVVAGSTVSNACARMYLPHLAEDPNDKLAMEAKRTLIVNGDELPYWLYGGGLDMIKVYSMMKAGQEKRSRWNGIAFRGASQADRRIWRPQSSAWLKEDFLLVSKLPAYSPTGMALGSVIVVAGGHGAGTEAFGLLLDPKRFSDSDLNRLSDALRGKTYFQVVFSVAVENDHSLRETRPVRLEVVWDDNLKPVEFTPSTKFLRRRRH